MILTVRDLARMLDLSAVRTDVDLAELRELADEARRWSCVCAFPMPCYVPRLKEWLADAPEVGVGGVVGFPSGAHLTETKAAEARLLREQGVDELDMVMNVGLLRSGRLDAVEADIRAVVEAGAPLPVKVILETHHLDDREIRTASEVCVRAGAAFVKTGTGWAPTGATAHNVRLIRETVGEAIGVKAAGGVRDLETLAALHRAGATRFGVGLRSGGAILEACAARPGGAVEI